LGPRLAAHQTNAIAIAELLAESAAVEKVYFPGLSSHPGHLLARRQQRGFGAMLSFDLAGGEAAAASFVDGMQCFTLAESLGGVESLIAHPATMTHASMDADARRRAGIGDGLLRLSVGIEALEDLRADIERGLTRAVRVREAIAA
ncbi:MAG TPA: PLP-dependent transferase, partial [Rudaea sp.]